MDVAHAVGERLDQDPIHQAQHWRERFLAAAGFEILVGDRIFGGVGRPTQINAREEGGCSIVGAGLHLGAVGGGMGAGSCLGFARGWPEIRTGLGLEGLWGLAGSRAGIGVGACLRGVIQNTALHTAAFCIIFR